MHSRSILSTKSATNCSATTTDTSSSPWARAISTKSRNRLPIEHMQYSTVIFDFDGTIADTEQIAFDTINALAPDFGFEPLRAEEMPRLKRMRMRELLGQRLRIPRWNVWAMYRLEKKSREIFAAKAGAIKIFSGME